MNLAGKAVWIGQLGQRAEIVQQVDSDTLLIELDNGQQMQVPMGALEPAADGSYLLDSISNLPQLIAPEEQVVVPVMEEQLHIDKRMTDTGHVRVNKRVQVDKQVVDEPLMADQVEVERVTMNRLVEQPPEVRQEGDTTIIPVVGEVLVVEKRLILQEEVRITRRQAEVHHPQQVEVRRETVDVDRD